MHVLVAGCGWLGTGLARALVARGDRVTGVRSSAERALALAAHGIEPLAIDLTAPGAVERLPAADAVVACQSAAADSPEGYREAYLLANRTLLEAARRGGARAFVYTGSTRVFGQADGSLVVEGTPTAPAGPEGEILVEAERLVLGAPAALGVPARLIRFSGLYGPGRAGVIGRVARGGLALGPGDDSFMNFCHLDDAVAFLLAALERGVPGTAYHGSDAAPPRRREVVEWVAGKLGLPPPRGESPGFGAASRRIDSAWTREALGVALRYPSFKEGFEALLRAP